MFVKIGRILLASFGLTLFVGCSGESSVPSAMVSGKVMLNGEPFHGAAIHFYNANFGGGAFNLTEDGEFMSIDPLPVAEYQVSIDRPGPTPGTSPVETSWGKDHSGSIPIQYRSIARSGLVARVSTGQQNHFVFELKGEPTSGDREGPTPFQPLSEFIN